MSTEANKVLIQRFIAEIFNNGNLDAVDELWIAGQEETGKQAVTNLRTAFPDYHRVIEEQVAEGDTVVTRWSMRGTHQGPFTSQTLGRIIAPTGVAVTVLGVSIHRIANGRIVGAWVSGNDSLELLRQLGAITTG